MKRYTSITSTNQPPVVGKNAIRLERTRLPADWRIVGLQEYTTLLSGTSAKINLSWQPASTLGLTHLLLHLAFILLVPIFLITAGLLAEWNRWKAEREIPVRESGGGHGTPIEPNF